MQAADILASMPVYDGRDPNISTENQCANCLRKEGDQAEDGSVVQLQRCSRCRCLHYCSQQCQKTAWKEHKKQCNAIAQAEAEMEREANKLRACTKFAFSSGPPENVFETQTGDFWGIWETRSYMRARLRVAELIYDLAYWQETVELWERVLLHFQEMLRLCSGDNLGLRYRFPFLLLYLNRDDDAYSFCRYWQNYSDDVMREREERHADSREGDWIYPRDQGCRYNDFLAECPGTNFTFMSLAMLVAVCIIKMRLVAAFDEKKKRNIAQDESPEQVQRIEDNRRQIQALMDQIHSNNRTMLPAILNPEPLKSQGQPQFFAPGHPSEAAIVLKDCHRAWVRVPGGEALLRARFGPNPSYNYNF